MKKINSLLAKILFIITCAFLTTSTLEAGGWGRTDEKFIFEGHTWNGVFYDLNGFHFTAVLPNYGGSVMSNGLVTFRGKVDSYDYGATTTINGGFNAPDELTDFVQMVQEANPNRQVVPSEAGSSGAKYVVDLIPSDGSDEYFRFFCVKDRVLKAYSNDPNLLRRHRFFDSIIIH